MGEKRVKSLIVLILARQSRTKAKKIRQVPVGPADLLDVGPVWIRMSLIVFPLPLNGAGVRTRDGHGIRRLGDLGAALRVPELEDGRALRDVGRPFLGPWG